jgi:hypothetical protein
MSRPGRSGLWVVVTIVMIVSVTEITGYHRTSHSAFVFGPCHRPNIQLRKTRPTSPSIRPCVLPGENSGKHHVKLIIASAVGSDQEAQSAGDVSKGKTPLPFSLRRARPHELDLLAILSTEAFTPRGEWYDVIQRLRFHAVCLDLQNQFYQRFYHV